MSDRHELLKVELHQLIVIERLSYSAVADKLGVTRNAVAGLCHRLDIKSGRGSGPTGRLPRTKVPKVPRMSHKAGPTAGTVEPLPDLVPPPAPEKQVPLIDVSSAARLRRSRRADLRLRCRRRHELVQLPLSHHALTMSVLLPESHLFAGLRAHGYQCVLIDPPTKFIAGTKGRPQHYPRMTDHEIAALPVRELIDPSGCFIFLWVTSAKLYRPKNSRNQLRPDEIAEAWGAKWSGRAFIWIKTLRSRGHQMMFSPADLHSGQGYTTRKNAEDCLLFKVGKPQRLAKNINEPIISPLREHSRKPDEVFTRIERFCAGPRVELFARETRPGWDTWGSEKTKFDLPLMEAA
jgi:N6-adenosine-specific RNA methylase IME4